MVEVRAYGLLCGEPWQRRRRLQSSHLPPPSGQVALSMARVSLSPLSSRGWVATRHLPPLHVVVAWRSGNATQPIADSVRAASSRSSVHFHGIVSSTLTVSPLPFDWRLRRGSCCDPLVITHRQAASGAKSLQLRLGNSFVASPAESAPLLRPDVNLEQFCFVPPQLVKYFLGSASGCDLVALAPVFRLARGIWCALWYGSARVLAPAATSMFQFRLSSRAPTHHRRGRGCSSTAHRPRGASHVICSRALKWISLVPSVYSSNTFSAP